VKKTSDPRGFTLLELVVVLALLGIFTSVLTLRVTDVFSDGDLRLASRMIIGRISALRGEAVYSRTEQALGLSIGRNTLYEIDPVQSDPAAAEGIYIGEEKTAGEAPLPQGVRLEDVILPPRGKIQEGEVRIRFFANGRIEKSLIHLRNEADAVYTLEINPLTGLVKVHDRYVEQKTVQ